MKNKERLTFIPPFPVSPSLLMQHSNLDTDFLYSPLSRVRKQLHVLYAPCNAGGSEEVGGLSGKRQIGVAVGSQMPLPLHVCLCACALKMTVSRRCLREGEREREREARGELMFPKGAQFASIGRWRFTIPPSQRVSLVLRQSHTHICLRSAHTHTV